VFLKKVEGRFGLESIVNRLQQHSLRGKAKISAYELLSQLPSLLLQLRPNEAGLGCRFLWMEWR